jgi:hypothetical protein
VLPTKIGKDTGTPTSTASGSPFTFIIVKTGVRLVPPDIHDIDKRLSSLKTVCAERYGSIGERVGRIKALGRSTLAVMLTSLVGSLLFVA